LRGLASFALIDFRRWSSLSVGGFNRSTQHPSLLIWHLGTVCIWRDMHGHGSRGSRRQSSGGAESAANRRVRVTRALEEQERCVRSWFSMVELLQPHAGELWQLVLRRPVELTVPNSTLRELFPVSAPDTPASHAASGRSVWSVWSVWSAGRSRRHRGAQLLRPAALVRSWRHG
jgi:hypothetical protein